METTQDEILARKSLDHLSPFERGYIACALWSSHDDADDSGGLNLDDEKYGAYPFDPESLQRMIDDCAKFRDRRPDLYLQALDYQESSRIGHDFWLTRNHHGAGFWDGDYPEELGGLLTQWAETFGECYLWVDDDRKCICID